MCGEVNDLRKLRILKPIFVYRAVLRKRDRSRGVLMQSKSVRRPSSQRRHHHKVEEGREACMAAGVHGITRGGVIVCAMPPARDQQCIYP